MKIFYKTPVVFFVIAVGILLSAGNGYADMGGIYTVDARVSEDAQKAIILHNGDEEILILGTDLKADKNVGLIRFIPFPSEPAVSLAPENAFDEASKLVKKHGLKMQFLTKGGPSIREAVSLIFHQKLGAHDITVIKINDVAQFRDWVNDLFKKKGLPQKESYPDVEAVAQDYVKRGIAYFVFDFVELEGPVRSIEPVMYRFKSKEFYYPLKTSNTFAGDRRINLIAACPRTMGRVFDPIFKNTLDLETSSSSKIAAQELAGIYPDAQDFLKAQKNLYLQMINYSGEYNFDQDMIADIAKGVDAEVNFEEPDLLSGDMTSLLSEVEDRFPLNEPGSGGTERFDSPEGKFSVSVPSGWSRIERFPYAIDDTVNGIKIEGPKNKDGAAVKIAILHYAGKGKIRGADHYIRKVLFDPTRLDFDKKIELTDTTVAGKAAKTFTYTSFELIYLPFKEPPMKPGIVYERVAPSKQVTVIDRYIVVPAAPGFYSLMYEAPEDIYEEYEGVFDAVVKSFEFKKD